MDSVMQPDSGGGMDKPQYSKQKLTYQHNLKLFKSSKYKYWCNGKIKKSSQFTTFRAPTEIHKIIYFTLWDLVRITDVCDHSKFGSSEVMRVLKAIRCDSSKLDPRPRRGDPENINWSICFCKAFNISALQMICVSRSVFEFAAL